MMCSRVLCEEDQIVLNQTLKDQISAKILPTVRTPGAYVGGELNSVIKDHRQVRGKLCLGFPDTYSIGMSHHGLQVLYSAMNRRADWACERAFTPAVDMEEALRRHSLPLYSLETFTPLRDFDVVGFTLQYEMGCTNVLTMLDLGDIPLLATQRSETDPLVIAGGPLTANPEPMARFIDLFVVGDGEESLPEVCEQWLQQRQAGADRKTALAALAGALRYVYVPRFYEPTGTQDGSAGMPRRIDSAGALPERIEPAVVDDFDAIPLPTQPTVPFVEAVQDRISIEIMRGCPGRCRFCQSTTLKRPLRFRKVETIVEAALESYHNTGYNEISLLSLSTSEYPHFDELMRRMNEAFRPLNVSLSVPSLRVNEQWRTVSESLSTERRGGLTLAPEVALDEMRAQVGKPIKNDDLYTGCRRAFENGFTRVKLYFMCGLPGETEDDLDGIIDMAENISRLGKEVSGRPATVVANVSNFVPKPQTAYQFTPMQRREYFREARERLYQRKRLRSVQLRCHDIEGSLLEGMLCRGDHRTGKAIELAWRRGARFDAWSEQLDAARWWQAFADVGIDIEKTLHTPRAVESPLPWDHVGIRQGRAYLEREYAASLAQLNQRM